MMDYCSKKVLSGQNGSRRSANDIFKRLACFLIRPLLIITIGTPALVLAAKYRGPIAEYASGIYTLKAADVRIYGNEAVASAAIIKSAGITQDCNLLLLNLNDIKRRVSGNPYIKEAEVSRTLPDKLLIKVTERKPFALLEDNGLWYVDEEGFPFKRVDLARKESLDYPVFTGIPAKGKEASSYRDSVLFQSFAIMKQILRDGIVEKEKISEINFSELYGFSIYTARDSYRVILGFEGIDQKLKRLKLLLSKLKKNTGMITIVDLDYSDRAIVKLKGAV